MITYAEVKSSPSGWPEENTTMSFQSELTELVDSYRNVINKHEVSRVLSGTAEIVEKDEGWIYDETHPQPASPTISALTPNTAVLGDPDVTMVVTGTDFTPQSVIVFNGTDEPIVFISDTEISTVVKPSIDWGAVAAPVSVRNGSLESNELDFTFTDPVE